jgi:catechol 2,3-dioxygenase-like lactoylglutathione lyase family enzyme
MSVNLRYIVDDVDQAIAFYRDGLDFALDMHPAPGFAALSRDGVKLYLNRPGAGGAGQPDAKGDAPEPGGWNRFQLEYSDLDDIVSRLRASGVKFRTSVIQGQGGRQILVEDPSGNLVELFEPKPH